MARLILDAEDVTAALATPEGRAALRPIVAEVVIEQLATLRPPPPGDDDMLLLVDAARLVGLAVKTLRRRIAAGALAATRDRRGRIQLRRGDVLEMR